MIALQTLDEILDGVLEWRFQHVNGNVRASRVFPGLHSDTSLRVIAADGPVGPLEHEPGFGLGLEYPRIGESPPTGFKCRKSAGIARDRDAVFVDFEAVVPVRGGGDFDRFAPSMKPCAKRGAVAEIIEQRSAALRFFIKPTFSL